MRDGQKITFSSEGDQEPGIEPGDIIIILDEKEHPVFKRQEHDLHVKMVSTFRVIICMLQICLKDYHCFHYCDLTTYL